MAVDLRGEKWGWYAQDETFYPKTMDNKCAPDKLLQTTYCKCKTGCSSMHCSCLLCTYICGTCQTDGCCNVGVVEESTLDEIVMFGLVIWITCVAQFKFENLDIDYLCCTWLGRTIELFVLAEHSKYLLSFWKREIFVSIIILLNNSSLRKERYYC